MASEIEILLRGFSDQERRAFLALGRKVDFDEGEVILPAGRSEWDIHLVEEGRAAVRVGNVTLAELGAGDTIGTSAILAPQIERSAIWGTTAGGLRRLPREAVLGFFEARPRQLFQQFCRNLFMIWVGVLAGRNQRIAQIQRRLLTEGRAQRRGRPRLLIVDDEAEIRQLLAEFFAVDYEVSAAQDGREALALALAERPDLILLDLRLPQIDGYQVCRQLKTRAETERIPIVMLTALNATPDKVKGLMYGADEYLSKPVDLEYLAEVVGRVLEKVYG
jgi:CheY-like chemotaxis protein